MPRVLKRRARCAPSESGAKCLSNDGGKASLSPPQECISDTNTRSLRSMSNSITNVSTITTATTGKSKQTVSSGRRSVRQKSASKVGNNSNVYIKGSVLNKLEDINLINAKGTKLSLNQPASVLLTNKKSAKSILINNLRQGHPSTSKRKSIRLSISHNSKVGGSQSLTLNNNKKTVYSCLH